MQTGQNDGNHGSHDRQPQTEGTETAHGRPLRGVTRDTAGLVDHRNHQFRRIVARATTKTAADAAAIRSPERRTAEGSM